MQDSGGGRRLLKLTLEHSGIFFALPLNPTNAEPNRANTLKVYLIFLIVEVHRFGTGHT